VGTEPLPITFTSYEHEPQTGDWSGIEFTPLSSGSEINHCVIEFAARGVACYAADLTIVDSVVEDNGQGIYVGINAAPVISGVTAVNNTQYGIAVCGDLDPLHNPEPAINGTGRIPILFATPWNIRRRPHRIRGVKSETPLICR
jgi:hypothetical protein